MKKVICFLLLYSLISLTGCSRFQSDSSLEEANMLLAQGSYQASLAKYEETIERYPETAERALFNMGVIYALSQYGHKDYQRSLQCFHKLIREHPGSRYRHDSEMMIAYIELAAVKDETIAKQQVQIANLQQDLDSQARSAVSLQKRVEALAQQLSTVTLRYGTADKILIEKKERRLTLLSGGEVIKTYRIALGGNPNGPKEREGDNKTPEGSYIIDSRSRGTPYHLSLHLSYPNEKDKRRARELGASPGGGIMIHGIRSGFAWVGGSQADVDWTQGCIAVTDEEIDEIARLSPDGISVEIRP